LSLTSFIDGNPTFRARLLSEFNKPEFRLKVDIKAPPLTTRYGLTGTAFDYLLRFYAKKLNPHARTRPWTAEGALTLLREKTSPSFEAKRMLDQAHACYGEFLSSSMERPNRRLAEVAVRLAYLENIYRVRIVDSEAFRPIPSAILDDLEGMLKLVRPEDFRATRRCVLNPTFGSASGLVGGADADLIIDHTLVDIKTGKHLVLDREIFNQLVGYYILSCIGGVDNCPAGAIKQVAVYYARYGIFHRIKVSDFVVEKRMPAFIKWFKECAKQKHEESVS
jgi:hypothetical protein